MIYLVLGNGIRQGLTLYKDLHDNKPPLLYLTAAIAGNLFWFKVILAFWNLVTIYYFWKLVRHLFPKNSRLQKISTFFFAALTTLPILEGNIANAELFFIGPIIIGFWLLLSKTATFKNLFVSGVLFSIAALFKLPAAIDMGVILVYWLLTAELNFQTLLKIVKKFSIVLLGFSIPILLSFGWYYLRGALVEYWLAAFMQNIGYLSSFRPGDIQQPFFIRNLPLIIRGLIVLLGFAILFWKRNKLSKQFIFVTVWLVISLFGVTLSERPYPHYLIQALASTCIFIGILVASKTIEQMYSIIALTLVVLVPVVYNFYYYSPITQYQRFIKFSTGITNKQQYFNEFDGNTARNYKVAEFLVKSSKPTDKVLVWGDGTPIYAISKRFPPLKYVAGYHISDFSTPEQVMKSISTQPPKFVIFTPETKPFPALTNFVEQYYIPVEQIDNVKIYALIR